MTDETQASPQESTASQSYPRNLFSGRNWIWRSIVIGWAFFSFSKILGVILFDDTVVRKDVWFGLVWWALMGLFMGWMIRSGHIRIGEKKSTAPPNQGK